MHTTPSLRGQGHHSGALGSREHLHHLLHAVRGDIHEYIFLILGILDSFYAEEEFVQHFQLFGCEILVGYEERLTLHHHLHLSQVVAHQGTTTTHDVKDGICKSYPRADLHRACDDMYVSSYAILLHETSQDGGIGCGYLLSFKPFETRIIHSPWNGQREATLAEAQRSHHTCILRALFKLVLPHYAQVCHARSHALGYIIVAQEEHLYGEIGALHQQSPPALGNLDTGLRKQFHGVFIEPSLRLHGYSQQRILFHSYSENVKMLCKYPVLSHSTPICNSFFSLPTRVWANTMQS